MKSQARPYFRAEVGFEAGNDSGGGSFVEGHLLRKSDGFVTSDEFEISAGSTPARRSLRLKIGDPLRLAQLMADLALAEPEDENADEFDCRLAFRDELAAAFEEAAATLRNAPRR